MLRLCVGAASRRVVEEAAKLGVCQVVASRRQAGEFTPGYTGYTSASLVRVVAELSGGVTEVVRDHGGPYQNGDPADDWTAALDADLAAGFDVLHLDVSQLPAGEQPGELTRLCRRYGGRIAVETGGERDTQQHLDMLLETALRACQPRTAVAALGGHIWADRQYGHLISITEAQAIADAYASRGVAVKAHNLDWMGGRQTYDLPGFCNVAPEFGNVEIDAWLRVLPGDEGRQVLDFAYATGAWHRWFTGTEGTRLERARAALRYHLETPQVARILGGHDDGDVREAIRDAIAHG
jgi:hypothetical protein